MLYNVVDYGAVGDGKTVNTKAIQKAINDCSVNGGRVLIPAGKFVTGSLELKSNIDLHFENGAQLIASTDLSDYNALDAYTQNRSCPPEGWDGKHLIWCVEQENISITGNGIIDGAGLYFFDKKSYLYPGYAWRFGCAKQKPSFEARPGQMIVFCESRNIKVTDINLINSTCWALYFHGCEYVQVRGITVKNENYHLNTDGIDIDACKYVTVSDSIIDTGDDAITFRCSALRYLKGEYKACEHITVNNCILSSSSSSFRIGVGTGIIRHIKVSNIIIKSSGIAIHFNPEWATSATPIYDVSFSNITAVDTGAFLCISSSKTRVSQISVINAYSECDSAFFVKSACDENVYNINFRDIFIKPIEIDVEERMPFVKIENVGGLVMNNVKTDEGEIVI